MMSEQKHILITAGPTHEPIDAVRYIANRSSGRMGVALAEASRDAGCRVTLLLGPVVIDHPEGVEVVSFESAADLQRLLDEHFSECDGLIMAAAVSDYRPSEPFDEKLPRQGEKLTLELEMTPDLVSRLAPLKRADQWIIGFALEEDHHLKTRALEKLTRKQLDAIVANPLGTMGSADVTATVFSSDGGEHSPGAMSKSDFTHWLIDWALSR